MAAKVRNLLAREGRYFARMVVPQELRPIVGKVELRTALGADRRAAIRALPRALAALQDQLAVARRRLALPTPGRPMSLGALAHLHYDEGLAFDDEIRNLSPLGSAGFPDENYVAALKRAVAGAATNDDLSAIVGHILAKFRQRGAMTADFGSPDWREAARMLAGVELEVLSRTVERDEGSYSGTPRLPILTTPAPEEDQANAVSITGLLNDYIAELARDGRGHSVGRTWGVAVRDLVKFLGHDDARRVSHHDLARWRDASLEKVAASSFKHVWFAGVNTILRSAVERRLLRDNPARDLKVRCSPKPVLRDPGFTDSEARMILSAALRVKIEGRDKRAVCASACRRWLHWFAAHTGARIGELAQLRKEDVLRDDATGIWLLKISPEAGAVKSRKFRDVPLHRELIEQGFIDFARTCDDATLFYVPGSVDVRTAIANASRLAGKFSRSIVPDAGVSPNHAWRHRFKTIGRELEIAPETLDALQGHKPRTAGEGYGVVSLRVKARAISKFPAFSVE
jgi:integrase